MKKDTYKQVSCELYTLHLDKKWGCIKKQNFGTFYESKNHCSIAHYLPPEFGTNVSQVPEGRYGPYNNESNKNAFQ